MSAPDARSIGDFKESLWILSRQDLHVACSVVDIQFRIILHLTVRSALNNLNSKKPDSSGGESQNYRLVLCEIGADDKTKTGEFK
jgi:hypothetical protein